MTSSYFCGLVLLLESATYLSSDVPKTLLSVSVMSSFGPTLGTYSMKTEASVIAELTVKRIIGIGSSI